MSYAAPQTIANELFGRIELLFGSDDAPTEFTKRQLLRDAEALAHADPSASSMVKAAIAAFSWDLPQAQHWIDNAMRLSSAIDTQVNAALTYKFLNRFDLAAGLSLETLKQGPRNAEVVNRTLSYLIWSGQLDKAVPVYQAAVENKVELAEEVLDPAFYLQAMGRIGVAQERLVYELAAAYDVLTQNRKRARFLTNALEVDPESGDESILFGLGFWGTLPDEMRLESQLAQVFSDQPDWNPAALSVELQYEQPQHVGQPA